MKAIKDELNKTHPEQVAEFEKGAAAFAKKIVANFKDYEFVCDLYYLMNILLTPHSTPART